MPYLLGGIVFRQVDDHALRKLRSVPPLLETLYLERAKGLLTNTDHTIPEMAVNSGFGAPEYLAQVFRREMRGSPLKYRVQIRGG